MLRPKGAGVPLSNPHRRYPSRRRPLRETSRAMALIGCLLRVRSVGLAPLGVHVMTIRISHLITPAPLNRRGIGVGNGSTFGENLSGEACTVKVRYAA